jgi:hypothetical protein
MYCAHAERYGSVKSMKSSTTQIYSIIYEITWHFGYSELHSQTQSSSPSSLSGMQQNIL